MTEWERTGDTKWRDKITAGMDSLAAMPYGIRSGRIWSTGTIPKTGKLYQVSDELGSYNLSTIQGGAEVVFELNTLVDNPAWQRTWLQYCRLYHAPKDVFARDRITGNEGADAQYTGGDQAGAGSPPTPTQDQGPGLREEGDRRDLRGPRRRPPGHVCDPAGRGPGSSIRSTRLPG